MRVVTIAAAVLGGTLVLAAGGWALLGHRAVSVPTIEAVSGPVRVKPTDPGGLQVGGLEDQLLGDPSSGADKMAPAAEAPAPLALRAQLIPAEPPKPAPMPATAAPPASAAPAPAAPPQASTAHAATPPALTHPAAAAHAAAAAVPAARPATAAAGGTMVQLGALRTHEAAQAEWHRLARRMPELLDGHHPVVERAESAGHEVWRIRTGGFADNAAATAFCGRVRAKGGNCTVATF